MKKSKLEMLMEEILKDHGLLMETEYRFHPYRKWRFDFADPKNKIAVECEGGIYVRGRHNRGKGFENDCEKYNAAAIQGWRVLRYTWGMIQDGRAESSLLQIYSSLE